MCGYSITRALSLPEFKVTQVHDIPDGLRIHVRAHKRKEFVCSKCRQVHVGKVNSCKDVAVEDLKILGKAGSRWESEQLQGCCRRRFKDPG